MATQRRGVTVAGLGLLLMMMALLAPAAVSGSAYPDGSLRGQAPAPAQATATATPSPSAPRTGQAGLVEESSNSGAAILFVAITVAVVAGGRLLTSRDR